MAEVDEKKSPWSKPLTLMIALIIIAVIVVFVYSPDLLKNLAPAGKIYERGTGVAGYLRGIEPTYTMVYGSTIDADQTSAGISFAGKYGITSSKLISEISSSDNNLIVIANSDDSKLNELFGSLLSTDSSGGDENIPPPPPPPTGYATRSITGYATYQDSAIVAIDEDKGILVISGDTKQSTNYAINFLKSNPLCENLNGIVIVIPNNGQCTDVIILKTANSQPIKGTLAVEANKAGVSLSVYLLGTLVQSKTVDSLGKASFELDSGTYEVKASLSNYRTKSSQVIVESGKTTNAKIEFTDADVSCAPTWSTGNWGVCANKIQTRTVAKSNDCPLDTGKPSETQACCQEAWSCAEWSVCQSGSTTSTRTCTIVSGCEQSSEPSPQITKDCPTSNQAEITIITSPAGASIAIDGATIGTSGPDGLKTNLEKGSHTIKVELQGYESMEETITIEANVVKNYDLTQLISSSLTRIKNNKNSDSFKIVIGSTAALSDNIGGSDIAGSLSITEAITDSKASSEKNMILLGGPCVNSIVANLASRGKFPYTCASWPGEDFSGIYSIKDSGKEIIVIAGTNAEDTRRGARIIARLDEFSSKLNKKETKLCGAKGNINSIQDCGGTDFTTSDFTPCSGIDTTETEIVAYHRILLAKSPDGLTWTRLNKIISDRASVPELITDKDGNIRLYYIQVSCKETGMKNIPVVAISYDQGSTWVYKRLNITAPAEATGCKEPGGNPPPVDPDVVVMPDGSYRLYATCPKGSGLQATPMSFVFFSDDGINFKNAKPTYVPAGGRALDPVSFKTSTQWHLYNGDEKGNELHATSSDGITFTEKDKFCPFKFTDSKGIEQCYLIGDAIALDNLYRIYLFGNRPKEGFKSITSTDGENWVMEQSSGSYILSSVNSSTEYYEISFPTIAKLNDGSYITAYETFIPETPKSIMDKITGGSGGTGGTGGSGGICGDGTCQDIERTTGGCPADCS